MEQYNDLLLKNEQLQQQLLVQMSVLQKQQTLLDYFYQQEIRQEQEQECFQKQGQLQPAQKILGDEITGRSGPVTPRGRRKYDEGNPDRAEKKKKKKQRVVTTSMVTTTLTTTTSASSEVDVGGEASILDTATTSNGSDDSLYSPHHDEDHPVDAKRAEDATGKDESNYPASCLPVVTEFLLAYQQLHKRLLTPPASFAGSSSTPLLSPYPSLALAGVLVKSEHPPHEQAHQKTP